MKRKIVAFIGILLIFSILTGCSKAITEGEVISKEFTPAHTQIMFIPIVHTNGKTSYTTLIPFYLLLQRQMGSDYSAVR